MLLFFVCRSVGLSAQGKEKAFCLRKTPRARKLSGMALLKLSTADKPAGSLAQVEKKANAMQVEKKANAMIKTLGKQMIKAQGAAAQGKADDSTNRGLDEQDPRLCRRSENDSFD